MNIESKGGYNYGNRKFYEAWFERFKTKLAREDMRDETAPFINLNRPEDRKRLILIDKSGIQQALLSTGEISDDQKMMLYHTARRGLDGRCAEYCARY
jgi:hypothetical protein